MATGSTVTDPTGRTWAVHMSGTHGQGFTAGPGARDSMPTTAVLTCTSGDDRFVVELPIGWYDLPNDELWAELDRKRRQQGRGTSTAGSGN